jgi:Ca2+-binding EF-hand superfamily protein
LINLLSFPSVMHLPTYVDRINRFLLSTHETKLKIAFDLYDTNDDGKLCFVDLFNGLKRLPK